MRLHPVNGFRQVVVRDCMLCNGIVLPKGTFVLGSTVASYCDARYWAPSAMEFMLVCPLPLPHCIYAVLVMSWNYRCLKSSAAMAPSLFPPEGREVTECTDA
jgi:hypothetical protein